MALYVPEYLQTQKYSALRMRQLLGDMAIQAGAVSQGDLLVTQRAASANMSVDIAAGAGFVRGTTIGRQGLYHTYSDAVTNVAVGGNSSGNPRLDQVVLRIYDSIDGAAGIDQATLEVLPGTPSAGATLDNRTGALALPDSCLRIADVLVATSASSITNAVIRDRRPWAKGFQYSKRGDNAGNHTTTSTTLVSLGAGQYDGRFEKGENSYMEFLFDFEALNVGGSQCAVELDVVTRTASVVTSRLVRPQGTAGNFLDTLLHIRTDQSGGTAAVAANDTYTWNLKFSTSNAANAATVVNNDVRVNPIITVREIVRPSQLSNVFTP